MLNEEVSKLFMNERQWCGVREETGGRGPCNAAFHEAFVDTFATHGAAGLRQLQDFDVVAVGDLFLKAFFSPLPKLNSLISLNDHG